MEKRSPLFYVGLILLLMVAALSFGSGTLSVMKAIGNYKSTSYTQEILISSLAVFAFIVGYFVGIFPIPSSATTRAWLLATPTIATAAFLFRMLFIMGSLILIILHRDRPLNPIVWAGINYCYAGIIFALASNLFRRTIKI